MGRVRGADVKGMEMFVVVSFRLVNCELFSTFRPIFSAAVESFLGL